MIGGQICKDKSLWVHEAYKETVLQKDNCVYHTRNLLAIKIYIVKMIILSK